MNGQDDPAICEKVDVDRLRCEGREGQSVVDHESWRCQNPRVRIGLVRWDDPNGDADLESRRSADPDPDAVNVICDRDRAGPPVESETRRRGDEEGSV